jgi:hypothetical protein
MIQQYVYRRFIGITVEGQAGWWALFSPDDSNTARRLQALHSALLPTDGSAPMLAGNSCFDLRGPLNNRQLQYIRHGHTCGV